MMKRTEKLVINPSQWLFRREDGDFDLGWQESKCSDCLKYRLKLPKNELKAALLSIVNNALPVVQVPTSLQEDKDTFIDYYTYCPHSTLRTFSQLTNIYTHEPFLDKTEDKHVLLHFRRESEFKHTTVYGCGILFITYGDPVNETTMNNTQYLNVPKRCILDMLTFVVK